MFGLFKRSTNRDEAHAWVKDGAVLLDVRTEGEFEAGHLEGAVNIPLQDLSARIAELDPASPVVVYCRSGGRSAGAAATLKRIGFGKVLDLGAMNNW